MIDLRPWFCSSINGVFRLLLIGGIPFLISAQASQNPITVESLPSGRSTASVSEIVPYRRPIEEDSNAQGDGIEEQYQLQLLQRDVMELRGLVEELTHQIQRMRATQEDRYLELDGRFQDLRREIDSGSVGVTDGAMAHVTEPGTNPRMDESARQGEKTLYETALELIRNRQYDLSITQLQAVIAQYPDGSYAANTYYWLGEVFMAKPDPDYDAARQAFAQVISFFPGHRKVPDATFKLGKVYHLLGDCDRATELLNQVVRNQEGKTVSKLAESYLRDKVSCQ